MSDAIKVASFRFPTARAAFWSYLDVHVEIRHGDRKRWSGGEHVKRAATTNQFREERFHARYSGAGGLKVSRLFDGAGKLAAIKDNDFSQFGGAAAGKLGAGNDAGRSSRNCRQGR